MPYTSVYFYKDQDGRVPVLEWLRELEHHDRDAFKACEVAVERLKALGFEIRRPHADYLRDGIYELRVSKRHIQYRILYFFHGQNVALLAHALTKEDQVPSADIERALRRKTEYERKPERHRFEE